MEHNKALLDGLIESISGAAKDSAPDDYKGDDGLIYCGKCHTRKQVEIEALGQRKVVWCSCKCKLESFAKAEQEAQRKADMERVEELKRASLMDERFYETTFDTFEVTEDNRRNYKRALVYAQRFEEMYANNHGLLFFGDTSRGKSFTAACIANYLLERQVPVIVTSFVKLLSMIRPFGAPDESEEKVIERINAAKLLIIDDLGAEAGTPSEIRKIYNVIDSRCRSKKPMIVTTNLTLREMKEAEDVEHRRIYERILEVCYPIEFYGANWRTKAAAKNYNELTAIFNERNED